MLHRFSSMEQPVLSRAAWALVASPALAEAEAALEASAVVVEEAVAKVVQHLFPPSQRRI